MRIALLPVALAGLAGAAAPAAPREDPLAGRIAGAPVECLDQSQLEGPEIIDSRTILYRQSLRRVWRNDLPEACTGLRPMATLIVEIYGSQLCRNDHFRARDPRSSPVRYAGWASSRHTICRPSDSVESDAVRFDSHD